MDTFLSCCEVCSATIKRALEIDLEMPKDTTESDAVSQIDSVLFDPVQTSICVSADQLLDIFFVN